MPLMHLTLLHGKQILLNPAYVESLETSPVRGALAQDAVRVRMAGGECWDVVGPLDKVAKHWDIAMEGCPG
jgi:uncharacterized protein YlzI (FlbEa/FlbD family)